MKKSTVPTTFYPALFLVLLPLVSGCYVSARGVVRPPRISVRASVPTPPTVTIHGTAGGSNTVMASAEHTSSATATPAEPPAPSITVEEGFTLVTATEVQPASVTTAPPPPPSTATTEQPATRPGYIWVRGSHEWTGTRWSWRPARWVVDVPDHIFVPGQYNENNHVWIGAHWEDRRVRDEHIQRPPRPQDLIHVEAPRVAVTPPELPRPPQLNGRVNVRVGASASIH